MEGNARLTASVALALFVLLAAEGVTLLSRRALLGPHVFIGTLVIPPVLLKVGSTSYRFVRYYLRSDAYRRRGPPVRVLRLFGPAVVLLTLVLLASGVWLLLWPTSLHGEARAVHKTTFFLWFGAMTVHVLGHLLDMVQLGPTDWLGGAAPVRGAGWRRALLVGSLAVGAVAGAVLVARVSPYLAHSFRD